MNEFKQLDESIKLVPKYIRTNIVDIRLRLYSHQIMFTLENHLIKKNQLFQIPLPQRIIQEEKALCLVYEGCNIVVPKDETINTFTYDFQDVSTMNDIKYIHPEKK